MTSRRRAKPLRLCAITSEFAPLAKTGGLADAVAGLTRALHDAGHDVHVFMPFYGDVDTTGLERHAVEFLRDLRLDFGGRTVRMSVEKVRIPDGAYWVHLLRAPELYDGAGIYREDGLAHIRFAALARGAIESCQRMAWAPDVFHCHDWHAALAPLYLKTLYAWDRLFARSRSLLTIHNIGFQGIFGTDVIDALGFGGHVDQLPREDLERGHVNFLRTGIVHAGMISTVSRTYAEEIQRPEHGWGLDGLLRHRREGLVGIVNGVDYGAWNPAVDTRIPRRYDAETIDGKRANTVALLERFGLPPAGPDVPVLGMVTRLTEQKGIDLLFDVLPSLLGERDVRLTVVGSGEERYESYFRWLAESFPERAAFYGGYSDELAHLVEAGANVFLMPSHFEPCGLNQMYSLRYGTPPIVRRTGGLADTVVPWDAATRTGTGFVFEHYTPEGVRWAVGEALAAFSDPDAWAAIVRNGMAVDYSWDRQVEEYVAMYERLIG